MVKIVKLLKVAKWINVGKVHDDTEHNLKDNGFRNQLISRGSHFNMN